MPLSILVGILNTGKPFPFSLCFITSKPTATFTLIEDMLDELFFYKYPRPEFVCGDFAKGLASGKESVDIEIDHDLVHPQTPEWCELVGTARGIAKPGMDLSGIDSWDIDSFITSSSSMTFAWPCRPNFLSGQAELPVRPASKPTWPIQWMFGQENRTEAGSYPQYKWYFLCKKKGDLYCDGKENWRNNVVCTKKKKIKKIK